MTPASMSPLPAVLDPLVAAIMEQLKEQVEAKRQVIAAKDQAIAKKDQALFAAEAIIEQLKEGTPPTNAMVDGSGVCEGRLFCHLGGVGCRGQFGQ